MSKKHFIALADHINSRRAEFDTTEEFNHVCRMMADFCRSQNPRFNRERWLAYIAGECGPNGGKRV